MDRLERKFEEAAGDLRDLRPILEKIKDRMYVDEHEIFDIGQGEWAPWSHWYADWRLSHGHFGSFDAPGDLLNLNGNLYRSLTEPGGENIAIVNRKSITFGTTDPVADYHREGVAHMSGWPRVEQSGASLPVRNPVEFTAAMKQRWYRMMSEYVKSKLT